MDTKWYDDWAIGRARRPQQPKHYRRDHTRHMYVKDMFFVACIYLTGGSDSLDEHILLLLSPSSDADI
jgi:hypothetical protein